MSSYFLLQKDYKVDIEIHAKATCEVYVCYKPRNEPRHKVFDVVKKTYQEDIGSSFLNDLGKKGFRSKEGVVQVADVLRKEYNEERDINESYVTTWTIWHKQLLANKIASLPWLREYKGHTDKIIIFVK